MQARHCCHLGAGPRVVAVGGGGGGGGGGIDHLQRETVAPPRNGRDRARPEDLAQGADLDLQVVAFNHQAWPHHVQQFVLRDCSIAPLDQRYQQIKRAGTQLRLEAVRQQLAFGAEQFEFGEAVAGMHGHVTSAANVAAASLGLMRPEPAFSSLQNVLARTQPAKGL